MKKTVFQSGMVRNAKSSQVIRASATGGLSLAACLSMADTPISVPYAFNSSSVIGGLPSAVFTTYPNTGTTVVDPGAASTLTYIKEDWYSHLNVPDSFQARADGSVPANWYLESITFDLKINYADWLAVNNSKTNSANSLSFHWTDAVSVYRNFTGSPSSPSGNLVAGVSSRSPASGDYTTGLLAAKPVGASNPQNPGDFPFARDFQGTDAYVAAPNNVSNPTLANPAYTRVDSGTTVYPAYAGSVTAATQIFSGTEFVTFKGAGPAPGTVPIDLVANSHLTTGSATGLVIENRGFSIAELTVTYVFVPEAGTWMAGASALALVGAVGRRRNAVR